MPAVVALSLRSERFVRWAYRLCLKYASDRQHRQATQGGSRPLRVYTFWAIRLSTEFFNYTTGNGKCKTGFIIKLLCTLRGIMDNFLRMGYN